MSHILDDFLFVGPSKSDQCQQDLDKFLTLCSKLGVPIKAEKTVQPTTVITIYGIKVDSCNMECQLPQEKNDKVNKVLASAIHRKKSQIKRVTILDWVT